MLNRKSRLFAKIAKCGSYKIAATKLNLEYSAVVHCVRALECDFGALLIRRGGKIIAPTEKGRHLLAIIRLVESEELRIKQQ